MPTVRDPFVDAVRALGTVGVVTVHWLMAEATWDGEHLRVGNALAHGAAWVLTWVLQLLPLLFFAAGAAATYQHTRRYPGPTGGSGRGGGRPRSRLRSWSGPSDRTGSASSAWGRGPWAWKRRARSERGPSGWGPGPSGSGRGRSGWARRGPWGRGRGASGWGRQSGSGPSRWRTVLVTRVLRVGRPVGVFLMAWAVAVAGLLALGVPEEAVWRLARMAPQLLWFLAVWVVLVALVPVLRRAWLRWRWQAAAAAVAAPLAVDLLRFAGGFPGADRLAWANLLLVWVVPFLVGIAYASDRAEGRSGVLTGTETGGRRMLVAALAAGVLALVVLVSTGPYPPSMIGMPGDAISNLGPPTAPIVALSVAQVSGALLARQAILRVTRTTLGGQVVTLLATRSMTVFLWHLTAMFVVVGLVLVGLGSRLPEPWSADWWASRPLWFAAYLAVLHGLLLVFGRFEGSSRIRARGARHGVRQIPPPRTDVQQAGRPRRQRPTPRIDPVPQPDDLPARAPGPVRSR